jgi:hypothetical protein
MKIAKSYFKVEIKTKPFLKKYLLSLYGDPLILSVSNPIGLFVTATLEKAVYPTATKEIVHRSYEKYKDTITVSLPLIWLKKYYYGTGVSESRTVFINRFFEGMFQKELSDYCENKSKDKGDRQQAIYDFCAGHNIDIPTDITFDNLKQTEFRYRKRMEKNPSKENPTKSTFVQQSIF